MCPDSRIYLSGKLQCEFPGLGLPTGRTCIKVELASQDTAFEEKVGRCEKDHISLDAKLMIPF